MASLNVRTCEQKTMGLHSTFFREFIFFCHLPAEIGQIDDFLCLLVTCNLYWIENIEKYLRHQKFKPKQKQKYQFDSVDNKSIKSAKKSTEAIIKKRTVTHRDLVWLFFTIFLF